MVDFESDFSLPENSIDNIEERFKKYEKSDNYNSRLIWDEDCVKIVLSAKYPLLRAFAYLLVGVVCIPITVTISWPVSGFAAFFGFAFFMVGLGALRGKQALLIHENHLEVRFDRMNGLFVNPSDQMNNPISNITAIKYCPATIEHTRSRGRDSFGPTSITTYHKISVTRIFLALTDEMKEDKMGDYENPWFDIHSKTKIEAEELAEALNFLIPRLS